LLPIENSENQPQQVKAVLAQKSSKRTVKCRRKAGHFRVNTGKMQSLQMPAFSLTLYSKPLILYCKRLTFGHTKISYFLAFLTTNELI
jgi:nitrite reductase/ring-hydroxylating ferredoxin subunit